MVALLSTGWEKICAEKVKRATAVIDTCGAPCIAKIFGNFQKDWIYMYMTLVGQSGAWDVMIHEKP